MSERASTAARELVIYDKQTDRALIKIPLTQSQVAQLIEGTATAECFPDDLELDVTVILEVTYG